MRGIVGLSVLLAGIVLVLLWALAQFIETARLIAQGIGHA